LENAHIKTHTVLDTLLSAVSAAVCAAMLCAAAAYVLLDAPRHGAAICLAGVAAALLLALPARGTRRFSAAKLGAAVALTALAVRAAYTLSVETVPVSDFELLYSAAQEVAGGNPGALSGEYFELWGYQKPFVYYEALVIALGGGTTALGLLNAAWGALTAWLVFATARRFAPDGAAFAAALLYALSPGAIMLTPVATNQCVSLALILLGVYLAVSGSGWRRAALAGCALAAGNLMRPEGIIAVGGLAVAAVLALARGEDWRALLRDLAALLLAYFALQLAVGLLVPGGIGNAAPEWKFVLGLDTASGGRYSDANAWILELESAGERRAAALDAIRASLSDAGGAGGVLGFFAGKAASFWGGYADSWLGVEHASDYFMRLAERATFIAMCALAAVGSLKRRSGAAHAAVKAAVAINFAAYLLIEVQSRYRYFVLPFLCILAAAGLETLAECRHRAKKRV